MGSYKRRGKKSAPESDKGLRALIAEYEAHAANEAAKIPTQPTARKVGRLACFGRMLNADSRQLHELLVEFVRARHFQIDNKKPLRPALKYAERQSIVAWCKSFQPHRNAEDLVAETGLENAGNERVAVTLGHRLLRDEDERGPFKSVFVLRIADNIRMLEDERERVRGVVGQTPRELELDIPVARVVSRPEEALSQFEARLAEFEAEGNGMLQAAGGHLILTAPGVCYIERP